MPKHIDLYWKVVKSLLRYLKGTMYHGLTFSIASLMDLLAYLVVGQANNLNDHKSTSGYCIYLDSSLISQSVKNQFVVLHSNTESKY